MKKQILLFGLISLMTLNISAQKYMGVYNDFEPGCNSSYCHETIVSIWEQSAHATAHPAQSPAYGYECLQCHNTGWDAATDNWGSDEFVTEAPGQTPNYIITPANQANWNARQGVQCEACHGPVGDNEGILDWNHTQRVTDYTADNCGKCHQGTHHPYMEEWQQSAHASGPPSYLNLRNRTAYSSCARCHFAQDFIAFIENPNYDAASFQPEGDLADITCVTCHDPHTGALRAVPSEFAGQTLCDVCHNVEVEEVDFNDVPHHTTSEALSSSTKFGWQYEEEDYSAAKSFHSLIRERCVACHVHQTGYDATTGTAVTGHTFEPRVESCAERCHTDYYEVADTSSADTRFDFRGVQTEIKGLWNQLGDILTSASSADSTTDRFKKALYNYRSIEAEGSWGIHNTKLDRKLLQDAIARMTVLSIDESSEIPTEYMLEQNYPNPFNPSTKIKFTLPEASQVKLVVYDALGKEVGVLVNEELSAGVYQTNWNGSQFSSGIYIYKLETSKFTQVKKMLLIK